MEVICSKKGDHKCLHKIGLVNLGNYVGFVIDSTTNWKLLNIKCILFKKKYMQ